ncbi:hypothetical protein B0H11DRAFT_592993 [Mycena galericulata]|nr:hypothetical protein B0H11DRAFT_592993 [Mycena galericulata]
MAGLGRGRYYTMRAVELRRSSSDSGDAGSRLILCSSESYVHASRRFSHSLSRSSFSSFSPAPALLPNSPYACQCIPGVRPPRRFDSRSISFHRMRMIMRSLQIISSNRGFGTRSGHTCSSLVIAIIMGWAIDYCLRSVFLNILDIFLSSFQVILCGTIFLSPESCSCFFLLLSSSSESWTYCVLSSR